MWFASGPPKRMLEVNPGVCYTSCHQKMDAWYVWHNLEKAVYMCDCRYSRGIKTKRRKIRETQDLHKKPYFGRTSRKRYISFILRKKPKVIGLPKLSMASGYKEFWETLVWSRSVSLRISDSLIYEQKPRC